MSESMWMGLAKFRKEPRARKCVVHRFCIIAPDEETAMRRLVDHFSTHSTKPQHYKVRPTEPVVMRDIYLSDDCGPFKDGAPPIDNPLFAG